MSAPSAAFGVSVALADAVCVAFLRQGTAVVPLFMVEKGEKKGPALGGASLMDRNSGQSKFQSPRRFASWGRLPDEKTPNLLCQRYGWDGLHQPH